MTGIERADGTTGFQRLAALGQRSRPARTSGGSGAPSFDLLVAEALHRQTQPQIANRAESTRPKGALGADLPSLASNSLTPTPTTPTPDPTPTAAPPADNKAVVGEMIASDASGAAAVNAANNHLGVPYLWGGTDPVHGFDCSGLIQDAYRQVGVELPKWSRHQATMGEEVASLEEALPGDILAFGDPVNHVALYVGDGKMLHAPRTGEVVRVDPIDRPIATIRRIVEPSPGQDGGALSMNQLIATAEERQTAGFEPVVQSSHTPSEAEQLYQPLFESAGERWDIDPALLAAVAKTESAFNPNAVSHVGAQGLMQFMPATAREMGVDPLDPASAIDGAARYLRTSLDQFNDTELAIASYNAGRGAVSRYDGIPPFPETQNYVVKVLEAWRSRT